MPQLSEIEEFKASLRSLGDEQRIIAEWGEIPVDDPLPEEGIPDDLAALMSDSLDAVGDAPEAGGLAGIEAALDSEADDFTSFLNDMDVGGSAEAATETPAEEFGLADFDQGADVPDPFAGLDLADYSSAENTAESETPEDISDLPEMNSGLDSAADSTSDAVPDLSSAGDFGLPDDFGMPEDIGLPESADLTQPSESDSFDLGSVEDALSALSAPDSTEPETYPDFSENTQPADDPAAAEDDLLDGLEVLGEPDSGSAALDPGPADDFAAPTEDQGDLESLEDATAPLDDFDSFDLSGGAGASLPGFDELDLGAATKSESAGLDDLDSQLAALDSAATETDNFSIDNAWGNDFHIPGFEMQEPAKEAKPVKPLPTDEELARKGNKTEAAVRPVVLTDAQVDSLQDTLLSYPLNLRLAVEDILANDKGTTEQQQSLVWMLVEGESAKEAAKLASRIFKRTIQIPPGYERRTGAALEAEKGTFAWIFRHSILPALQVIALAAAGLGLLSFLGYNFVFRPLYANHLYSTGYEHLEAERYPQSWSYFEKADGYWIFKHWYYRYAEAYAAKLQFKRAADVYLFTLMRWPKEFRAALDWARMESEQRFDFAAAEAILEKYVLAFDYFNRPALLLMTHNYLNWADYEEQKYDGGNKAFITGLYEKARIQLASLMEQYGQQDGYLELFTLYLMRTERLTGRTFLAQVLPMADYFLANSKRSQFSAATLAEMSLYLIRHGQRERVYQLLEQAWERDQYYPEIHVAGAAWYRLSNMPDLEQDALENAIFSFQRLQSADPVQLGPRRLQEYIRSLIRISELLKANEAFLDTEANLVLAIDEYEDAVQKRRFRPAAEFAMAYSHLADLHYERSMDYARSLSLYQKAEDHGYRTVRGDYRQGYIYYDPYQAGLRDYQKALDYFYRAGLDGDQSPYLLLATANTLYQRGDWFAAQAYYSQLIAALEQTLSTISQPRPQEKTSHGELVQLLMIARNNLGASLYRISLKMGDSTKRSQAMLAFSESARLYDSLSRDQITMIRSETKNMGYLNMDFVLHPQRGVDVGIYPELSKEL